MSLGDIPSFDTKQMRALASGFLSQARIFRLTGLASALKIRSLSTILHLSRKLKCSR
jgi:hypothetical protein